LELPAPLDDWGVVKGLLLRHFRWWSDKYDVFNTDGCLTIGFTYQNFYMCEDYNSPQSVYWALKSFLALGLSAKHPFWIAEEQPLPNDNALAISVVPPMHILCNTGNHHYLLSCGQFCPWPLKATEAKYGKFAYSSHFGFSVPTGPMLQQLAPDSTITVSKDEGDTWRIPWKVSFDGHPTRALLRRGGETLEDIPVFKSSWKPWKDADVYVETVLVAPCSKWPNWYVRFHRVTSKGQNPITLSIVQGGFAIRGRGVRRGEVLSSFSSSSDITSENLLSHPEGTLESKDGVLICSSAGASGIRSINLSSGNDDILSVTANSTGEVLKPDANTNLMWQRTLIPTVKTNTNILARGCSSHFASAVFAMSRTLERVEEYRALDLEKLWLDVPAIRVGNLVGEALDLSQHYIDVQMEV
jgi:hypothetical protein